MALPAAFGQIEADALKSLRTAVQRFKEAKISRTRYTYLDLDHTQNFNEKGKLFFDDTQLFEVTYIGDLRFLRLLQQGGKPLEGSALEAERKRYDDAVREHAALDEIARSRIQHQLWKDVSVNLSLLPDRYQNQVAKHEALGGRECLVIESEPTAGVPQKRYRLWLDPAENKILRMEFEQLSDEGDNLRGGSGMMMWIYMDDVPLVTASRLDFMALLGRKKRVRVMAEHTYSRFRKFSVTSKVVEVESTTP